jgi:hypothetical protein
MCGVTMALLGDAPQRRTASFSAVFRDAEDPRQSSPPGTPYVFNRSSSSCFSVAAVSACRSAGFVE